ncbi:energy transducer TonB [Sphingomonas flavalba]|uniref:energy transducer TonB family protein n=1 Tax=Sphingomonas flavalba TaxID=2559804 RepID=UPI0039DF5CC3
MFRSHSPAADRPADRRDSVYSAGGWHHRLSGSLLALLAHLLIIGAFLIHAGVRYTAVQTPTLTVIDINALAAPPEPPSERPPGPEQVKNREPPPVVNRPAIDPPPIRLPTLNPMTAPPPEPAATPAPPEDRATAPDAKPAPPATRASDAKPTWEGAVLAALNKAKRYPREAAFRRQQGVPYIRFAIDRSGRVLSVALEKSSGVRALDEEAVRLPRRAEPLPKPPQDVTGQVIELVVPVEFFMH